MQTFLIIFMTLFPIFCIITYKIWSFVKQMKEYIEKPLNFVHDQFGHLRTYIISQF
jgi:hypothetical protein